MTVKVTELHHHGIRIGPSPGDLEQALAFYRDVLGLLPDPGRPDIPGAPGFWLNVGGDAHPNQIHLIGITGASKYAQGPGKDPTLPHVALAVPDIQETKRELDRLGVSYWTTKGVTGPEAEQVFVLDPFGNIIELHQEGTCRCNSRTVAGAGARMS